MYYLTKILDCYREEFDLNLREGLIKSTSSGQSMSILKNSFPGWEFKPDRIANEFDHRIRVKIPNERKKEDLEKFLKFLNNLGWFTSFMETNNGQNLVRTAYDEQDFKIAYDNPKTTHLLLICEAKFDFKVDKIPEYLYHLTPAQSWPKIQKVGLIPKSKSKIADHPERVYLAKTAEGALALGPKFCENTGIKNWVLLKIHTSSISYLNLYRDPNYSERGFYTFNNIPYLFIYFEKYVNFN